MPMLSRRRHAAFGSAGAVRAKRLEKCIQSKVRRTSLSDNYLFQSCILIQKWLEPKKLMYMPGSLGLLGAKLWTEHVLLQKHGYSGERKTNTL